MAEDTLDQAIADLMSARLAENKAKQDRVNAEQRVLCFVANPPENGSLTVKGEQLRASVKFTLTYKADVEALRNADVDADLLPLKMRSGYEFDKRAYEALKDSHPDVFARLSAHVETKPAKPSVTPKT